MATPLRTVVSRDACLRRCHENITKGELYAKRGMPPTSLIKLADSSKLILFPDFSWVSLFASAA